MIENGRRKLTSNRCSSLRAASTTARDSPASHGSCWASSPGPLRRPTLGRHRKGIEFQFLCLPAFTHFSSSTLGTISVAAGACATIWKIPYAFLPSLYQVSKQIGMREPPIELTGIEDAAVGDRGRELGCGVGWDDGCLPFVFFREVSVPLASEAFGDPSRFRGAAAAPFFIAFVCFG